MKEITQPIIDIKNFSIAFKNNEEEKQIIYDSTFSIYSNEILGVVGESGSGKSVTALAMMGLLPKKISRITSGKILFNNQELTQCSQKEFQKIRGSQIAMIFQEPMSALNPSMRCGKQVAEILERHSNLSKKEIHQEVIELFRRVKLPNPEELYKKYPHQISGGQKQRVMIAMAIACKPKLLIADEPTTALDVTVQKEIIALIKELQQQTQMSVLFITHDLALIAEIADRILVMQQGKIVEQGNTEQIFHHPNHIYTKALIVSRPSTTTRLKKLPVVADFINQTQTAEPISEEERKKHLDYINSNPILLEIQNVGKIYISSTHLFGKDKTFQALKNISLTIREQETLGLVGESGCGKSTLGNAILMLDAPTEGKIFYKGTELTKLTPKAFKKFRKDIQIILQDPYTSLNPKKTVLEAITEPMKVHNLHGTDANRKQKALELIQKVGLSVEHLNRYPHEFSGGQRQRINIARTIAVEPKLIICDESVSALDLSVQAQVLNLLNDLKETYGFTYIFISHDLAVVKYMSDRIAVMNQGIIEELNEADALYENPQKDYTQKLINAIPKGI